MAMQAQDTFIAVLDDGTERLVSKGDVLPDGHELVKRDAKGSGLLFKKLDLGEEEKPKSEPEPEAGAKAAPVRAARGKT